MQFLKFNQTLKPIDLYRTAILAALWAFIEITFGTWLHAARLPFRGLLLSIVASGLLVFSKSILQYRGSLILLGFISISIKTTLTGVFILNPILAMMMESIFAEICFTIFKPNAFGSVIGGMVVLFYTFIHSVIAQIFFFGFDIVNVYVSILGRFIAMPIEKNTYALLLILAYLFIHLFIGAISGWFGYKIAQTTKIQLALRNEII